MAIDFAVAHFNLIQKGELFPCCGKHLTRIKNRYIDLDWRDTSHASSPTGAACMSAMIWTTKLSVTLFVDMVGCIEASPRANLRQRVVLIMRTKESGRENRGHQIRNHHD
jgi:hypothetical protein